MTLSRLGHIAGHLPTFHNTGQQPIRLQQAQQPALYLPERPRQELIIGPEYVQHEGRVLRLADDAFQPEATALQSDSPAHQASDLPQDSKAAPEHAGLFTGSDLEAHDGDAWSRSQFTQTADLIKHNTEKLKALKAASHDFDSAGLAAASHAASSADVSSGGNSVDVPQVHASESLSDPDSIDALGMLGTSDELIQERHHPDKHQSSTHTLSHTPSYMAVHPHGDHNGLHPGNPPASPTCFVHPDLPIPGMDIAPAGRDRCYAQPPEYKNKVPPFAGCCVVFIAMHRHAQYLCLSHSSSCCSHYFAVCCDV